MLDREQVDKELKAFQERVIKQSRSNLTRLKKNSSNTLYKSLKGSYKVNPNSIELDFEMEAYGQFQDKGVSGVRKKYDTPFSYTDKQPPASVFDKWVIKRGIAPRNAKGQFQNRKGIAFAIARSIYFNGIKPSLFFTKPFENEYKKLSGELIEAYGLDIEKLMDISLEKLTK